jgi:DNA gyrase subunit B
VELASQPEYRRLRTLAKQAAKLNRPPFVVVKDAHRDTLPGWRELLAHVKTEGTREVTVQRYKGLGEMNANQLWETTMDPTTRSMIKVSLEDAIEADKIFNLLMGDAVEPRRDYIEKHAANVRDLDI